MTLVDTLWPQKEWFGGLLSFLVDIPLKFPGLWNLPVHLHVQKFHRGLESLRLHGWKLSSALLERHGFLWRLQILPP